ncbi:MAG: RagB/SusD family nutrient uptake outer membrane protein [Bacteroidota bacterium]
MGDRLLAEAKFVRGLAYFELVKHFGDVPLITQYIASTDDQIVFPRSSSSDVYAQIERDLEEAAANLDIAYDSQDQGRATSGAAYTLLAKVHLYQEEYAKVREYTEVVINSNVYNLEANYADNWSLDNEYGIESIFEIGYADGFSNFYFESAGGETNQGSSSYQMFGYIFANTGTFGNSVPRQELIDLFDDNDSRKDATFITPTTVYEGAVQSCGCAVLDDCTPDWDSDQSLWVGTDVYNFFWTNPDALCSRATMRKYDIPSSVASSLLQLSSNPLNEKMLRYADVLLMHAEAAVNGAGGDGQASLDAIRQRAGLSSIPLTMENVKLERRKELATEGWDRFTDLVRWGDAATALAFKGFRVGRDELLPIPQGEIDLVGSDVLSQNPGY